MSEKPVFLTEDGLKTLTAEVEHLRNVRRMEVAERIQRAKELESTANNAEYDDAKNEQAFIEGRILDVEGMLKDATIVHHDHPSGRVEIGSQVRLKTSEGEEETYTIVGSAEASAAAGKISNESPVGLALLGKRVGQEIEVAVPSGVRRLKLMDVT